MKHNEMLADLIHYRNTALDQIKALEDCHAAAVQRIVDLELYNEALREEIQRLMGGARR